MYTVLLLMSICIPTPDAVTCSEPAVYENFAVETPQDCAERAGEFNEYMEDRIFIDPTTGTVVVFGAFCKTEV
jgi:hypothetical protein